MEPSERNLALGIKPYSFADLYEPERLAALFETFTSALRQADAGLATEFSQYHGGAALDPLHESAVLVRTADHLNLFLAQLFKIEADLQGVATHTAAEQVILSFKRDYVGKRLRKRSFQEVRPLDAAEQQRYDALENALGSDDQAADLNGVDPEMRAARTAIALLQLYQVFDQRPAAPFEELTTAEGRVAALLGEPVKDGKARMVEILHLVDRWHLHNMRACPYWVSYHLPQAVDPKHVGLVQVQRPKPDLPEAMLGPDALTRPRDGFGLTDTRLDQRHVLAEVDYCLFCHERGKDSCRKGLHDKAGTVKQDPKGIELHGCPLGERISEAHWLRNRGALLGALAMIVLDNPMCPGTGHRICNDCMKACIFQKQEPVNIPQVETSILSSVLHLPFGFEIYALLTRWNPLNRRRPYPATYRGYNVLVAGLGPAGYTLSHYLLNEGFGVVGIDGLKIEPLPDDIVGRDVWPPAPLKNYHSIENKLSERVLGGFGGVAEYGITVRWDKNFLKVIHLTLARRRMFRLYGGIRFGGTLDLDDAWKFGFHHVAIAAGAGKPTIVNIKNNLLRGMRAASDFLMSLQLTGAFKESSLANLQVELPALVIGGGLTAVDTATELAAYYPVQVEKLLKLVESLGLEAALQTCDGEERGIAQRMLQHARDIRLERQKEHPDIAKLIRQWGGVSVVYRRSLQDSPAYRLNHEEVQKALEEGIYFIENLVPREAVPDEFGHLSAIKFSRADGSEVCLPARCVMVAAGTSPNVIYERELPGTFKLDQRKRFFLSHRLDWSGPLPALQESADADGFFTSYQGPSRRFVTYYGDNHPRYAGNVVRAMASAKDGYREVARIFADEPSCGNDETWRKLVEKLEDQWLAKVHQVNRLGQNIIEVVVRAPMQARKFQPGQFYRLQNFEALCPKIAGKSLTMEGLALTGAWVDEPKGLLSLIALEMGVSSRICGFLRAGDPVVVMGPTGAPTEIPEGENVLLCGGGLGNAVLFSVAKAMHARGNRVIYFAGYRSAVDLFKREEIEQSCDQVVWSHDLAPAIVPSRPQDIAFTGNIVQAMQAYAEGSIGPAVVPFDAIDRIIAIGSDRMMAAVTRARKTVLAPHLRPNHAAIASINSPMQCMMKEVCAQCLQRHVDPKTGEESFVFSCFNQDQSQDTMDWTHLAARLRQNTVMEKTSNLWLTKALTEQTS